jgi:hypothetical protein
MAKKQTRRSVSIRGTTYDRVRDFCERSNISMSEFVEERIASFFGDVPAVREPAASVRLPKAPRPVQGTAARPAAISSAAVPSATPQATPHKTAAASAPPAAPKKGNGGESDRLSFDQLHDAARYFTF